MSSSRASVPASRSGPPKNPGKPANNPPPKVTRAQVETFEQLAAHLTALHREFALQAKSKPDNPINTFKLKVVNEKIAATNQLLGSSHKPLADFETFDPGDLPSNSDVALVLASYLASLERWRSAHVFYDSSNYWQWRTDDGSYIKAVQSTRFDPGEKK